MGGGAVGHAARWRADATRSTPEACGRAPLPGNARHRLRAEQAVGISRPGAGRRVTVAKVGVRLAGLWEPRIPSSRTSDPVPDSRLGRNPLAPFPQPASSQTQFCGPSTRTHVYPQAFLRLHLFGPRTRPRAGLTTHACQEGSTPQRHVNTPRKPWATPAQQLHVF